MPNFTSSPWHYSYWVIQTAALAKSNTIPCEERNCTQALKHYSEGPFFLPSVFEVNPKLWDLYYHWNHCQLI